jgi:hypothetical protein
LGSSRLDRRRGVAAAVGARAIVGGDILVYISTQQQRGATSTAKAQGLGLVVLESGSGVLIFAQRVDIGHILVGIIIMLDLLDFLGNIGLVGTRRD